MALAVDIRRVVRELDPRLPWIALDTGSAAFLREIGALSYVALSLGALGTIGLVLAAGGLYTVMWLLVVARRRELGIRLAIGADRRDVLWLVFVRRCGWPRLASSSGWRSRSLERLP